MSAPPDSRYVTSTLTISDGTFVSHLTKMAESRSQSCLGRIETDRIKLKLPRTVKRSNKRILYFDRSTWRLNRQL